MTPVRQLPTLPPLAIDPPEPVSFVTVRFCDEYRHNIARSECVRRHGNELVTVDNRSNLFFPNLGRAINQGLRRARHDLIVVVHEDVLLPRYWEQHLFRALAALEADGQRWGLLGCAGWPAAFGHGGLDSIVGHWNDPRGHTDRLGERLFAPVARLDEHLMVLRASHGTRLDPNLPSIHNIGRDLPLTLAAAGRATFVINAPTIHKYADADGRPIERATDSAKIRDRKTLPYLADRAISDRYFAGKWGRGVEGNPADRRGPAAGQACAGRSNGGGPVVLVGAGAGEARLLAIASRQLRLSVVNAAEPVAGDDDLGSIRAIYEAVITRLSAGPPDLAGAFESRAQPWGLNIPEAGLVLGELARHYPDARFVHLVRDPLVGCRAPLNASAALDNPLGRLALAVAYRAAGRPVQRLLEDPPDQVRAIALSFQLQAALDGFEALSDRRWLRVRVEDLVRSPAALPLALAKWTGFGNGTSEADLEELRLLADEAVGALPGRLPDELQALLQPLRARLGYERCEAGR